MINYVKCMVETVIIFYSYMLIQHLLEHITRYTVYTDQASEITQHTDCPLF